MVIIHFPHFKSFENRMKKLRKMFSDRKFQNMSLYDKEIAEDDKYYRLLPTWRSWPEYKRGYRLGQKFRNGKGTMNGIYTFIDFTKLPQKKTKEQVIKALILGGFDEGLTKTDSGLYSRFEEGDYKELINYHTSLYYLSSFLGYVDLMDQKRFKNKKSSRKTKKSSRKTK